MLYKRRLVPGTRDFPQGCGVFSGHRFSSVVSTKQSDFMSGTVRPHRDLPDFSKMKKKSSNYSETEPSRVEGLDNSCGVAKEKPVTESGGCVQNALKKKVVYESEGKPNKGLSCLTKEKMISLVKKRRLSVHNSSTMKVQRDVSNISKRVIVLGLAATSTCPWRQPKSRRSRQEKRKWFL